MLEPRSKNYDINKDHPNEKKTSYLFSTRYSKEVSHHDLFGRDSSAGRK